MSSPNILSITAECYSKILSHKKKYNHFTYLYGLLLSSSSNSVVDNIVPMFHTLPTKVNIELIVFYINKVLKSENRIVGIYFSSGSYSDSNSENDSDNNILFEISKNINSKNNDLYYLNISNNSVYYNDDIGINYIDFSKSFTKLADININANKNINENDNIIYDYDDHVDSDISFSFLPNL